MRRLDLLQFAGEDALKEVMDVIKLLQDLNSHISPKDKNISDYGVFFKHFCLYSRPPTMEHVDGKITKKPGQTVRGTEALKLHLEAYEEGAKDGAKDLEGTWIFKEFWWMLSSEERAKVAMWMKSASAMASAKTGITDKESSAAASTAIVPMMGSPSHMMSSASSSSSSGKPQILGTYAKKKDDACQEKRNEMMSFFKGKSKKGKSGVSRGRGMRVSFHSVVVQVMLHSRTQVSYVTCFFNSKLEQT